MLILTVCAFGYQGGFNKRSAKQLDQLLNERYDAKTPGCVILVAENDEIVFEKAYGSANIELGVPMKTDMVFRIGSITKEFTSVAILQLVERGMISLDDKLSEFFPSFKSAGDMITIENLLTHTSGIQGYEQFDAKIPNAIRVDFKTDLFIDSLSLLSLEFAPGTKFNYSNSNYYLLGNIIEKVTGETYSSYLEKNIFDPLGLNSTQYDSYVNLITNRVDGYSCREGRCMNVDYISMSTVYSAGALLSNVYDLFSWHCQLYANKVLKSETLEKALTPYRLQDGTRSEYGYGFFNKMDNGTSMIGHAGVIDGFQACEVYYPAYGRYVVLLCNSDGEEFSELLADILDLVRNGSSVKKKEIMLSDSLLTAYEGTYFNEEYGESIKVYKEQGRLYGDLSNGTGYRMVFKAQSETNFVLPQIRRVKTTVDFVWGKDKVEKAIFHQEKANEFLKQ